MEKQNGRPAWHGHTNTISKICGCSKTTVSKVLNGKENEVTSNNELIKKIRKCASELLLRDSNMLLDQAMEKQKIARLLVA